MSATRERERSSARPDAATVIGAQAHALLVARESAGRVLAVVSQATYLITRDGELLWLGARTLPAHPRSILGAFDWRSAQVGATWHGAGGRLALDDFHALGAPVGLLDLSRARLWRPPVIQSPRHIELAAERALNLLAWIQSSSSLRDLERGNSLGRAIPLLGAIAKDSPPPEFDSSDAFIAAALPLIREVASACRAHDLRSTLRAAQLLIGLGPGLTPSGDDFVGALLFVLFHLSTALPGRMWWEPESVRQLLAASKTRTHCISYALLSDYARGWGVQPLYDLLTRLLEDTESEAPRQSARRLLEIGSTSGWDLLAGALTGLLVLS